VTEDARLQKVLEHVAGKVSLKDALRRAALVKALFGAECVIESKSPFGIIIIERRNKAPAQRGGPKSWISEGDPELAAVLSTYQVRDVRLVRALFGNVKLQVIISGDEAVTAYQRIVKEAGSGRDVRL
jgi:hypothetical protein